MYKTRQTAMLCGAFICILGMCGCSDSAAESSSSAIDAETAVNRDLFAMDTYMNLRAYGENADTALDKAAERIEELESTFSVTAEKSDVWEINHSGGNAVNVSQDTLKVILQALVTGSDTDGALDISLYPVVSEWGFTTGDYKIPTEQTLKKLLEKVDYRKITVLDSGSVIIPEDFQIDLGALAKGYTSDEVIRIMKENGVESGIISLGGNVQALGTKPDGSEWKVSVRNPFEPETDMCIIEVGEKAVITSGNYERFFVGEDGNSYWHIIDSSDGFPADNGIVSATIIGDKGVECDALSTALFVAGYDRAVEYWKSRQDFDMILVTDSQEIFYTVGLDTFTNISSMPAEVIALD